MFKQVFEIIDAHGYGSHIQLLDFQSTPMLEIRSARYRASVEHFTKVLDGNTGIRNLVLKFIHCFIIQTAQTSVANANSHLEERLARWLLMARDRVEGNLIKFTYERLSTMLGATGPSVTLGVHSLDACGLISHHRGTIEILDAEGLKSIAGPYYGVPEAEYERLILQ